MAQVFISYAREDQDFAEVVQAKLERAGHTTTLDLDLLRAGDDWGDRLDLAIRSADAMVLVMTPDAWRSAYVPYEWAFALGAGVRLIPLDLTASERHPRLEVLQRLDFTSKARPWESLLAEVARAAAARAADPGASGGLPTAVQQAIRALDSLDGAQRLAGVTTLASAEGEQARLALAQALRHPLRDVRAAAARLFPDRRDPRIVRGLVEGEEQTWDRISFGKFRRETDPMGAAAVPELLALLAERAAAPATIRAVLVDALGRTADARATPALLAALRDGDAFVRSRAAIGLGASGDRGTVAALLAALADPSASVRAEAATALGRLGDRTAVPALLDLLAGDESSVRRPVAEALQRLADPAAIPALGKALDDADPDVRIAAAEALGHAGDPAGAAFLQRLLEPERPDISSSDAVVMRALVKLDTAQALPDIERRLAAFRGGSLPEEAIQALAARGQAGVALLSRVLAARNDDSLAKMIARALAGSDALEAREALRKWRLRN